MDKKSVRERVRENEEWKKDAKKFYNSDTKKFVKGKFTIYQNPTYTLWRSKGVTISIRVNKLDKWIMLTVDERGQVEYHTASPKDREPGLTEWLIGEKNEQ